MLTKKVFNLNYFFAIPFCLSEMLKHFCRFVQWKTHSKRMTIETSNEKKKEEKEKSIETPRAAIAPAFELVSTKPGVTDRRRSKIFCFYFYIFFICTTIIRWFIRFTYLKL